MPAAAPRPCRAPGCAAVVDGSKRGYCDVHADLRSSWKVSRVDRSGSTTQRGYGWRWQQTRQLVLIRDKGLCQIHLQRGEVAIATDVDHIQRKESGGSDDLDNLQALCKECHKHKTATEGRGYKKYR